MINILELPKAVKAATDLFRTGHELKNAAAWKNAQIVGNALSALLVLAVVIAHVFGYSMPDWANDTAVQYLAAGIASIANVVLIVWTSKKVGLPARISDDALPPIELQARAASQSDPEAVAMGADVADSHQPVRSTNGLCDALPPISGSRSSSSPSDGSQAAGWNG